MASPFGGIDPSILALFNQGPSDEEKKAARQHALLAAGLSMMQNANQRPLQAIGSGGLLGMGAYNNELGNIAHQRQQNMAGMGQAVQLQNQLQAMQDQAGLRKAETEFSSRFGVPGAPPQNAPMGAQQPGGAIGPGAMPGAQAPQTMGDGPAPIPPTGAIPAAGGMPAIPQGGVPNKRAIAQKYQDMGDYWMQNSAGNPQILAKAQQYYDLAQKTMPKLKDTKAYTQNGKRVLVQEYEDGTQQVVPDLGPDKEKAHFADAGNALIPMDPYGSGQVGAAIPKSQSPDSKASNAVAWANHAETKRRNDIMEGDPGQIEATAQLIANGKMPPPSGFAAARPIAQSIMARVAQLNPEYSAIDYNTGKKAEADFATGKTGNQVRSFNVALAHLDTLGNLADALHNGNVQLVNKIGNAVSSQVGSPAPTNFNAAKQIVSNEIVKAIVGSGGGVEDRAKAQQVVADANSPAQLKGVIETYKTLMGGQLGGLRQQYQTATKRNDFDRFLSPEAQRAVSKGAGSDVRSQADKILQGN